MTATRAAARGVLPGQDLAAAGYIGLKGTAFIAAEKEEELKRYFTGQFIKRCKQVKRFGVCGLDPAFYRESGASSFMEAGEGGIMAALWDYFEECGLGFEIELRTLPILQETVEVCEMFDINPYRLHSEGCVLLTSDNGGDLIRNLKRKGIHAVVIGKVESGIKRRILNGETETYLDRPKPDEQYKIQLAGGKV